MIIQLAKGIEKVSKLLDVEFSYSNAKHNFELGLPLESSLKNFFRPYFPNIYGFTSGYLVDENSLVSNQCDWIIYNKEYFSPILGSVTGNEGLEWVSFDSVYGTVEVKRMLDSETFEKAVDQISKQKQLYRLPTNLLQVTPLLNLPEKFLNIKEGQNLSICNYFYNGIYSYSSDEYSDSQKLLEKIKQLLNKYKFHQLPDFIAIHGRYYVKKVGFKEGQPHLTPFINNCDHYIVFESGTNTSGYFYTDLITQFANTKLSALSTMGYFSKLVNKTKLETLNGLKIHKDFL